MRFSEDEGGYRIRIIDGQDGYDRTDDDIRKLNKTFESKVWYHLNRNIDKFRKERDAARTDKRVSFGSQEGEWIEEYYIGLEEILVAELLPGPRDPGSRPTITKGVGVPRCPEQGSTCYLFRCRHSVVGTRTLIRRFALSQVPLQQGVCPHFPARGASCSRATRLYL